MFTPTIEQADSATFRLIVGDPKYTPGGQLVSTIYDGSPAMGGVAELKNGNSMLDSSYQLRLQVFGAKINDVPYTIYTDRPVNPTFKNYIQNWGIGLKAIPK